MSTTNSDKHLEFSVCENDYMNSSNAIFHFMKKDIFLYSIIENKALAPRYYDEDISYITKYIEEMPFKTTSVLQKCFCDIQIHDLLKKSPIVERRILSGTNDELFSGVSAPMTTRFKRSDTLLAV